MPTRRFRKLPICQCRNKFSPLVESDRIRRFRSTESTLQCGFDVMLTVSRIVRTAVCCSSRQTCHGRLVTSDRRQMNTDRTWAPNPRTTLRSRGVVVLRFKRVITVLPPNGNKVSHALGCYLSSFMLMIFSVSSTD